MKKPIILLLIVSIIVNGYLVPKFLKQVTADPETYVNARNEQRTKLFHSLKIDSTDIVFVGDSQTEDMTPELLGGKVKNRGIAGNKTRHVVARIEEIAKYRPYKIFLEVGINDVIGGITKDSTINNYRRIFDIIQKESPDTKVFVNSVMPVRGGYAKNNKAVIELNEALSRLCDSRQVTFINVNTALLNGGTLDESMTYDGLHLTEKGYNVWVRQLIPVFAGELAATSVRISQ